MKKIVLFLLIVCLIAYCKKTEYTPEGPTDVRIRNQSSSVLSDVFVKIKDEEIFFGEIGAAGLSEYHRFKTAFPKAYISSKINGEVFTTGQVDFTYQNYFGQVRMTYEVIIDNNFLKINNVVLDSHLNLK
jgi:hypothetical protein